MTRDAIVNYMSDHAFTNIEFTRQITGTDAVLEIYNLKENMLYFSLTRELDKNRILKLLTVNPEIVEFGKADNGNITLGKYTYRSENKLFFRFPKDDFRVESTRSIKIDFGKYTYTQSIQELTDFSANRTIYGGDIGIKQEGSLRLANHGALVGIKNEPSLKRLVQQIIAGESSEEKIAQLLLSFVNENIAFSEREAEGRFEILKRPNEVLMTRNSDCSGLTILYASLLEQTHIDYRLVYYIGHISVGVEGNFPKRNGLSFESDGKLFHIAETTTKNFRIGHSKLAADISAGKILYIQKPGKPDGETRK